MGRFSESEIEEIFSNICNNISEKGMSLRQSIKALEKPISSETFYKWLDENEGFAKRYARACEMRAESIFEDILKISDDESKDTRIIENEMGTMEVSNHAAVQRSKLKVDARKWILAKMNPKKYGEYIRSDQDININKGGFIVGEDEE